MRKMTVSQKRAIWYKKREKELHNQECFLIWKDLLQEYETSKYKYMINFIKSKGLAQEYYQACHYYGNNLENLPRRDLY